MKIVMAQINYTVGDIRGNLEKILTIYEKVKHQKGLLICSELALTGYYPQDLLLSKRMLNNQDNALQELALATQGFCCGIVVGYVARNQAVVGKKLHNALALLDNGKQVFEYHKQLLPTYNVFDEARHFKVGSRSCLFEYQGSKLGFLICEDAWAVASNFEYAQDPVRELEEQQLDLVISINASPSNIGKTDERYRVIKNIVNRIHAPIVYLNQVGGNDELVFDGASFVINRKAQLVVQLKAFEEHVSELDIDSIEKTSIEPISQRKSEFVLKQTALGIKDYVHKCGFKQVVIGSSGGIDSAVTLAICVEALGAENVKAITMPSKYSSAGSVGDSKELCENLGIQLLEASIKDEFELSIERFRNMTGETPSGLTQENIQARIRGRILMEYSNHYGALVISTGNKSEMSVGYATLYGDMNGGVNPLGDLYKMEVYALARYINESAGKEVIPNDIINKAPSAELSEAQKDSDSLPEYPLLDAILKLYIEGDLLSENELEECQRLIDEYGVSEREVAQIRRMVDRAEFKRRQAPPIVRVQKRSFGMGRWLPVAARYQ